MVGEVMVVGDVPDRACSVFTDPKLVGVRGEDQDRFLSFCLCLACARVCPAWCELKRAAAGNHKTTGATAGWQKCALIDSANDKPIFLERKQCF